jgi:two-component system alkaline phosphatase synthesis response regulator PhoP
VKTIDPGIMSPKKRILVVDDEPDHCTVIQRILERQGFEVDVAYDGVECLAKVRDNPPDAIILDVVMPEKDGHAVCREIKSDACLCRIPVMILSAESGGATSTRYSRYSEGGCLDADDYLHKPASAEKITRHLKSLLNF